MGIRSGAMTTEEAVETIRRWDFEPGKGGVPRVPEWVAPMFDAYAAAVLHLPDDLDDDALLCHQLLRRLKPRHTPLWHMRRSRTAVDR